LTSSLSNRYTCSFAENQLQRLKELDSRLRNLDENLKAQEARKQAAVISPTVTATTTTTTAPVAPVATVAPTTTTAPVATIAASTPTATPAKTSDAVTDDEVQSLIAKVVYVSASLPPFNFSTTILLFLQNMARVKAIIARIEKLEEHEKAEATAEFKQLESNKSVAVAPVVSLSSPSSSPSSSVSNVSIERVSSLIDKNLTRLQSVDVRLKDLESKAATTTTTAAPAVTATNTSPTTSPIKTPESPVTSKQKKYAISFGFSLFPFMFTSLYSFTIAGTCLLKSAKIRLRNSVCSTRSWKNSTTNDRVAR
jgi:hypothetical protein